MKGGGDRGALSILGQHLAAHGLIYVVGTGIGAVLALTRVVVLTRILEIPVYGQLAILILTAGFVSTFCRVAFVSGTIRAIFRGGDEEGAEDEELGPGSEEPDIATDEQRRILATGIIATLALTALLTGVTALAIDPIERGLIGSGSTTAVLLTPLLGGLGAVFYLISALARFERRPVAYVSLETLHGLLAIGVAVIAIEAGYGIDGAMAGLVIGSAISLLPAAFVSRHRLGYRVDPRMALGLVRLGLPLAGITLGFWMFRNADLFMVSRYLSDTDVAIYQVAARVGLFSSALVGGVIMAWGPLMRGPLRGALHREGRLGDASARVLTYFWFLTLWLLIGLVMFQDQLVRIAPGTYESASSLIPLVGASALSTSLLLMIYRATRRRKKREWFVGVSLTLPVLLVGLCIVLIPWLGLEGAAIAGIVAPGVGSAVMMGLSQRGDQRLEMPWKRLIMAGLLALPAFLVAPAIRDLTSVPLLLGIVVVVLYPAALVLFRVLPRAESRVLAGLLRRQRGKDLSSLEVEELELIEILVRRRAGIEEAGDRLGRDQDELLVELVDCLRRIEGLPPGGPSDALIGRHLAQRDSNQTVHDRAGHLLSLDHGLDALELQRISATADSLARIKRRRWLGVVAEAEERDQSDRVDDADQDSARSS